MRQYSHAYRRKNPTMFPEVCTACKPERRFKYPYDKAQHNQCLHGCIPPTGRRETYGLIAQSSNLFDHYSFVTPRETLLALSPMTKPRCPLYNLSTVGLDRFVKDEVEPDGPYNDSCKAVIHRLCEFMKNNFPSELRPSEIIKVFSSISRNVINIKHTSLHIFCNIKAKRHFHTRKSPILFY